MEYTEVQLLKNVWFFNFQARLSTPKLGSSSVLRYTPHTELDYGSVVCLATNDIGQQLEPCVFHIIAAGEHENFIMINDYSTLIVQ